MSEHASEQWVSVIALAGWLILALSSFRAHQIGAKKTVVMALAWISIFFFAAALFSAVSPGGRP